MRAAAAFRAHDAAGLFADGAAPRWRGGQTAAGFDLPESMASSVGAVGAIMRKAAASAPSWNAGDQNSSGLQIPPRSRSRNSLLRMTKYTTSMMTPVMIHETG